MFYLLLVVLIPVMWLLLICLIVHDEDGRVEKGNNSGYNLRMKFLNNYDWACKTFGTRGDKLPHNRLSYELGLETIKESNKTFDRWVVYFLASNPEYYYPNVIEDVHVKSMGNGIIYNEEHCVQYMKEFNRIVLQYKSQQVIIDEVKGLGVPLREYLKPVTRYKPQPIVLD